ncbi:MAG: recombinase zinc beta ribbon domain-containing protein, partial [Bacteroidaceae bacterium]|nr:recombinase zinc beta ribbon domain-containing protein [Bacteroidaceae bacterium]
RYKGDALLQKQFTVDFLNKKMKNNEGEVPQYYVTDSHPAIIDRTEWELVQAEMARRKEKGNHQNSLNVFSSKIYCGECGSCYGSKVWHSTDKYRRVVWRCNGKYERQTRCSTPHLTDDQIKRLFLSAVSKLHDERETLIEDCKFMREILSDTSELEAERTRLMEELTAVGLLTEKLFEENATGKTTTDDFDARHASYIERYNDLQSKLKAIADSEKRKRQQIKVLDRFIKDIRGMKALPIDFSDRLWNALVEKLTIYPDGTAEFLFKNGTTVTERL